MGSRLAPATRVAVLLAGAAMLASSVLQNGRAADPQPYEVEITPTGEAPLDAAVRDSATLLSLKDNAPVGPFALLARARRDRDRFATALHSFGYYDGQAEITVAGLALGDPGLASVLEQTPSGAKVKVEVRLERGPLYRLGPITLHGDVAPPARAALGLKQGEPARAADVLRALRRMLDALRADGHALAKVQTPAATLDPATHTLAVSFEVEAGPRVDLGPIAVTGLERTNESYVRRRLLLRAGAAFDPGDIERARQDLAAAGPFSAVRVNQATELDTNGRLPLTVQVTERPLRTVDLSASYSTDLGGQVTASWTHHNLFGNAEQLVIALGASQLGGTAALQPGYNASVTLTQPDWLQRGQSITYSVGAVKEYLDAYDRTAILGGATVARRLDPELSVSMGLGAAVSRIQQEGVTRTYKLVQLPLGLQYDTAISTTDPTHGVRASLSVTPTESISTPSSTFVIMQAAGAAYMDFSGSGRSVLAARALVGATAGASTFDIPPDQRFYAGGGGSVRGFRFQSIGPQFPDQRPTGGTSVDTGSIEFRQRFGSSYGGVVFVDAGQVGTRGVPFEGKLDVGAGVGARYYTSIGPIRLDVAVPVTKQSGGDAVELYIGIGHAF